VEKVVLALVGSVSLALSAYVGLCVPDAYPLWVFLLLLSFAALEPLCQTNT
jgi:hypothetical protein